MNITAYIIFGLLVLAIFMLYKKTDFLNFKGLFNRKRRLESFKYNSKKPVNLTIDQEFNSRKINKQKEIDRILDKISRSGIKSISNTEREFLDKYSNEN
ncbi:MAG: hypothetical protein SLAVMIC_00501 [uncultured marine phage]|uniref:DUF6576 domain-containing protein n=1 Tax=uncultured marine phage TaxID=707152 RepID=A0A8D9C913_9VIRU|nr:MAG: hypothetical protein SLAVMIC_00501 [uncultured marine phage]